MRILTATTLWLAAGALSAAAQDDVSFAPAPEMAGYQRMIGNWQGKGTVRMDPDAEPMPWTSVSTAKAILGGHFIQDDMAIDVMPGEPPLVFRSIVGWDRARNRPFAFSLSNMGDGGPIEMRWIDDNTVSNVKWTEQAGEPLCSREITRYDGDTHSFQQYEARGAGDFILHVEGSNTRGGPGFDASNVKDPFVMPGMPLPGEAEMKRLFGCAGDYVMKGEVVPMPGVPLMHFTGHERMQPILAGTTFAFLAASDPDEAGAIWEGNSYMIWDGVRGCYLSAHMDNMGMCGVAEARLVDDRHIVLTHTEVQSGVPGVSRSVFELDDKGHCVRVTADQLAGVAPAQRTFAATYTYSPSAGAVAAPAFRQGSCCDKAAARKETCSHPCCVAAAAKGEVCAKCN